MESNNLTKKLTDLCQEYVDKELSKKLSNYWDSLSIVLGGSVSYGVADEYSDLDLFVIYSSDELSKLLPINTKFKGKKISVEKGSTWSQLEQYFNKLPDEVVSIFWNIQKAIILHDPEKRYEKIQKRIDDYLPDEFWKKKILRKWFSVFYCSSNGLLKALNRGDFITAGIWRGKLIEAILELTFLINRQYLPPTKWLHKKFIELPILAKEIEPHLSLILETKDIGQMKKEDQYIWEIFNHYIKNNNLLSDEVADKPWKYI